MAWSLAAFTGHRYRQGLSVASSANGVRVPHDSFPAVLEASPARLPPGQDGPIAVWTVGEWMRTEIRTVGVGDRQVTVFGECAVTDPELHRLAVHGVTNRVVPSLGETPGR